MKKKKAKKMSIKVTILFLVILGSMFGIYYTMKTINSNEYKLKKLNYSIDEINTILTNEIYINYALENNDKIFLEFIKDSNYKIEFFDSYLHYYKEHNNVPINDIIYLINNDIKEEYSENLMNFTKEKYYLKTRLSRYLKYLENHTDLTYKEIVKRVNSDIDYDFYTNDMSTNLDDNYLKICNKFYKLDSNYIPENLVYIESKYLKPGTGGQLEKETYEAFKRLSDAARNEGLSILSRSPYRSYQTQYTIYNNYVKQDGKQKADTYSARPGYSEHQTGLALDVGTKTNTTLGSFQYTNEYNWMQEHAYEYGFIMRYPKGEEYITGYMYESWHYRYVGTDAAKIIHDENLTYEEYYTYYVLKK